MTEKAKLVFVSGWGAGSSVWERLETSLAPYFDISHLSVMKLSETVENVEQDVLIEGFAEKIPYGATVVAWSLGGMFAAKVAARHPERIVKLILIATNLSFVTTSNWVEAMDKKTFSEFKSAYRDNPERTRKRFIALQAHGDSERKRVVEKLELASELNSQNVSLASKLLDVLGQLNLTGDLARLNISVQFLFGKNDALVPSGAAESLRSFASKVFPGNQFDVVQLECCGHAPHVSFSEQCIQHMFRFLKIRDVRYKKDKKKIARSFSKSAKTYNRHAALQKEVSEELMDLASEVEGTVADLGCGTGYCVDILMQKYIDVDRIFAVDFAENMLAETRASYSFTKKQLCCVLADMEHLPFKDGTLDWVVSSLAMQWCDDLESLFSAVKNAMSDSARFLFSTLSENTLFELEQSWAEADPGHVHVNQFTTTAQIIDLAEAQGFELQHFETKRKVLQYESVMDLMKDLKGIGAHNVNDGINKGLTGVKALSALSTAYEIYRNENGKLPATYDVEYWLLTKRRLI